MNWAHLPEPGGIYAQNPKLLERFEVIMTAEAKHEAAEARKREAQRGGRSIRRRGG